METVNLLLRDIHGEIKVTNKRLEYLEDRICSLHDRTSALEHKANAQTSMWRWLIPDLHALLALLGIGGSIIFVLSKLKLI